MEKQLKQARQSNFELLRIICMVLIVAYHYSNAGFSVPSTEPVTFNVLFLNFIGFGGQLGVDMFVLISGYFMIEQKFKIRRAVRLWLRCVIIPAFMGVIALICGRTDLRSFLTVFFTPINNSYWFITTYFLMFILSDYINALIHAITKNQHLTLICVLAAVYTVLPTFFAIRMDGSTLMLFVLLYLIAAYIRIYSPELSNSKYCLAAGIGFHLFCNLVSCVFMLMRDSYPVLGHIADRMRCMGETTIVIAAVIIFCGFKNLNIKYSKAINFFGASTLGVYLVHENIFTNRMLWVVIMQSPGYLYSSNLVLFSLVAIIAEYAVSMLIDMAYLYSLEGRLMKLADRVLEKLPKRLKS